ncbi:hypothetical protein PPYR_05834 [Photinus pyralis]|uniref:Uncharacterized protein n=1 Tax=Photinus pyralis TaxID=7054 RepID=A0A1Y1KTX6_PHOPY|nr:polyadenylate-binding protein-interacting protein 2-like [Photinus pyralis]XP_031336329.1 polyadenylate-binding protein-interacting protein 2-like [Photinus pyralis]XP_031336330.1 polyadenylate-binding protein-interacting protein 2-like [Photinus pyralis]XP_031337687.1 polyadenylate-binding protein-interacting protein 2-like [Photinus pyralis]XP_031337688.1 polyadenylate-binding protein-interacting protein 2-like [Photinus pyralis]XP_031337690.1 polyadenylate-binding protein-interacting pro
MKMPPQKPVGNGYYGYEDIPHIPENEVDNSTSPPGEAPIEQATTNSAENDFAEYLWMEHEEEFDKQVMQQLEEEELMEQCIEAMLEEEQRNLTDEQTERINSQDAPPTEDNEVMNLVNNFRLDLFDVTKSTLNPLAAEFVPDVRGKSPPPNTE